MTSAELKAKTSLVYDIQEKGGRYTRYSVEKLGDRQYRIINQRTGRGYTLTDAAAHNCTCPSFDNNARKGIPTCKHFGLIAEVREFVAEWLTELQAAEAKPSRYPGGMAQYAADLEAEADEAQPEPGDMPGDPMAVVAQLPAETEALIAEVYGPAPALTKPPVVVCRPGYSSYNEQVFPNGQAPDFDQPAAPHCGIYWCDQPIVAGTNACQVHQGFDRPVLPTITGVDPFEFAA